MTLDEAFEKAERKLMGGKVSYIDGIFIRDKPSPDAQPCCAASFQNDKFTTLRTAFIFVETEAGEVLEWRVKDFKIELCPYPISLCFKRGSILIGKIETSTENCEYFRFREDEEPETTMLPITHVWGVVENHAFCVDLNISAQGFIYCPDWKNYSGTSNLLPLFMQCIEADQHNRKDLKYESEFRRSN